jgi:hypothetical protein
VCPDQVVALQVHGRSARLEKPGRGRLVIHGVTMLPTGSAVQDATVVVTDLLDNVGASGELVAGGNPSLSSRRRRKKVAVFETAAGIVPRLMTSPRS